jgi:hypothetical protein
MCGNRWPPARPPPPFPPTPKLTPECAIITLVYVNRIITYTGLALHATNWKRVVLGGVLMASKVWDDQAGELGPHHPRQLAAILACVDPRPTYPGRVRRASLECGFLHHPPTHQH